jgi:hypothetical protein
MENAEFRWRLNSTVFFSEIFLRLIRRVFVRTGGVRACHLLTGGWECSGAVRSRDMADVLGDCCMLSTVLSDGWAE